MSRGPNAVGRTGGPRVPIAWALGLSFVLVVLAWAPLLGASLLWGAPAVVVAITVVVRRWPTRRALLLAVIWIPAAPALAGVPWRALRPGGWDDRLVPGLQSGVEGLGRLAQGGPSLEPWTPAVAFLGVGLIWIVASVLATRGRPGRVLAATLLLAPWLVALMLREGDVAPWQGALVAAIVLAWMAARTPVGRRVGERYDDGVGRPERGSAVGGRRGAGLLAPGLVVALLLAGGVAALAHAVAPRDRWLAVGALLEREAPVRRLETEPSYGPLGGRRTGAVMFTVRSERPALWRMQVLERVGTRGWGTAAIPAVQRPDEPGAVREEAEVEVEASRDQLLLGPGRIVGVDVAGDEPPEPDDGVAEGVPTAGEGRRLLETPSKSTTYTVTSRVVRPSLIELRDAPDPSSNSLRRWTAVSGTWFGRRWGRRDDDHRYGEDGGAGGPYGPPGDGGPSDRGPYGSFSRWSPPQPPLFGRDPDPGYDRALGWGSMGDVLELAREVTRGSETQLEAVEKVQRFLLEGDRFRYDTDLPQAGRSPLAEFLLEARTGYCQHFAGGAALMLRLVGVPTRVVSGYATGTEVRDGVHEVHDTDAHQWIEVYFVGIGWVPFDPTPAADAVVDAAIDPLRPSIDRGDAGGDGGALPIIAIVTALGLVGAGVRRARGGRDATDGSDDRVDLLGLLARRTGTVVVPGTTHATVAAELERHVGRRTASLARRAGHASFAPSSAAARHPSVLRVARAVRDDVGLSGAAWLLLTGKRRGGPADDSPRTPGEAEPPGDDGPRPDDAARPEGDAVRAPTPRRRGRRRRRAGRSGPRAGR
ncbi:MAG: transglutaminase domain-containing protein [Solirubrobacteraceae bacterium]